MITARMVAAGVLAAAIVIPNIAPVAQAQDSTATATTDNPTMTKAQSEVVVKPINIGDKTISGTLLLRKGESSRNVAIRWAMILSLSNTQFQPSISCKMVSQSPSESLGNRKLSSMFL